MPWLLFTFFFIFLLFLISFSSPLWLLWHLFTFGQLFVYFFVWHVDFRSGSANIRASQLFNARGKKLVASPTSLTASKATQTSIGSSTSTSMASIKRVQENQPVAVVAPSNGANNSVVNPSETSQKVKDRTLFQRLFQR